MERLINYKNNNVDLSEINNLINDIDDRLNQLYYLKYMEFKKNDILFYINDIKENHDSEAMITVALDINKIYIVNVNQYENNNIYLYSASNHDLNIYFINCYFNKIFINTFKNIKFFNCYCNELHIENFDKNIEYWPNSKKITLKEPKALNYKINLKNCNMLETFEFYQVNNFSGLYDLKLLLSSSVKNLYINATNFNGDITFDNYFIDSDYFNKCYIKLNWLWYFICFRALDLTSTYDSTKFIIDLNSSYSNTIRVFNVNTTLIALLKSYIIKKSINFNNITLTDLKQYYTLPNFINSSWNGTPEGIYTWTIKKLNNISGFIDTESNFKGYITSLTNTQLLITINTSIGF